MKCYSKTVCDIVEDSGVQVHENRIYTICKHHKCTLNEIDLFPNNRLREIL